MHIHWFGKTPQGYMVQWEKESYKTPCGIKTYFCYILKLSNLQEKRELENLAPKLMAGISGGVIGAIQ